MDGHAGCKRLRCVRLVGCCLVILLTMACLGEGVPVTTSEAPPPPGLPQPGAEQSGTAAEKPPAAAYFFYMVGYFHELIQRFSEAQMAYRRAIDYDPQSPVLLASLVSALA